MSSTVTTRIGSGVVAWLGWVVFIVYGSLVPLDYHPIPLEKAWLAFQHIQYLHLGLESRADWVANGVLYLPAGYLTATVLLRWIDRRLHWLAMLLAGLFCITLAVGVEFTQIFFPPRTVSLNDIIAECLGSVLGIALAPGLMPWLSRFQARWRIGGRELVGYLLQAYAVGYVLLCLFPYDFLLSVDEFRGKLASSSWGWWLAGSGPRPALATLQLGLEVVLALPYGVWLARRRQGTRLSVWRAATLGLLLGLAIEGGQMFVESGISQGASLLSRSAGVVLGVMLWRERDRLGLEVLSSLVRRHVLAFSLAWGLLLAEANGWLLGHWQGLDAAVAAWPEVRLLPFYYHYYTTEAHALFSLLSVALMYMPLAALGWSFRWSTATTMVCAVVASGLIELSKLFLAGAHPDPTNLLIAAVACAMVLKTVALASRWLAEPLEASVAPPAAGADGAVESPRPASGRVARPLVGLLMAAALAGAGVGAAWFPVLPALLCLSLAVCAAAVWQRPVRALAIVPAALPLLDLAPWSGRFFWDEFDLLQLVCLAVGLYRAPPVTGHRGRWDGLTLAFALVALSLAISTLRGLLPWQWPDANAFSSYYSPYNALRIVKGGCWAFGFVLLLRRLQAAGNERGRMFALGVNVGLAGTVAFIFWERAALVGLLDFASDYRVTGPVSAMHKGGAYIECLLALASAFTVMAMLQARSWTARVLLGLLVLGATYAEAVTYSRNGYAAFVVAVLVVLGGNLLRALARPAKAAAALGLLALVGAVAFPIVAGPYARERLSRSGSDLGVRRAHWADAMQLRDAGSATGLLGMGLGRFPESHFWRSREAVHAGSFGLQQEAGEAYLRMGAGASIYLEQIVDPPPGADLLISARLRSSRPGAVVGVALCRKWLLTSGRCASASLVVGPRAEAWQPVQARLKTDALVVGQFWQARLPLKLALVSPTGGVSVDIDDLRLSTASGANILVNGDFSSGLDRWFFTTDVDPPWHIHSLPVNVLFDQGWLGVTAWAGLFAVALARGLRAAWGGSGIALASVAAVLAFAVSGSLNTLIDTPRFLFLLLVLLWLCGRVDGRQQAVPQAP